LNNRSKIIIVSNNPAYWIETLNRFPELKVIFFLIGNETYEPKHFNVLNQLNNLYHAFVYNAPTKILLKNIIGGIIGNFFDGGHRKSNLPGSLYREARISISLKNKFNKIEIEYPFTRLPQGYSNSFATKISKLANLADSDSLISLSALSKIRALRNPYNRFAFLGQSTNRRRENFLKVLSKYKFVKLFPFESGFGGNNVDESFTYLNHLLESDFVLVPPGYLNNLNHRYTESLICGAIPVILSNNSLDPSINENWTNQLSFLKRYSAKLLVNYLDALNSEMMIEIRDSITTNDFNKIFEAKKVFLTYLDE
jgi:hypothetical protein